MSWLTWQMFPYKLIIYCGSVLIQRYRLVVGKVMRYSIFIVGKYIPVVLLMATLYV